jgi:DNA-binding response OmpR family regulator|nr:winged helix-turn-helix domain-containing protein [uncultured Acetatifactor sp.]
MGKVVILAFAEDEEDVCQRMLQIVRESPHFEGCNVLQVEKYLNFEGMKLNLAEKNVVIHGVEVMLTNREFEILYLLAQNSGRIFSKEQIYDIVWQEPYSGDYNIVTSHIRHIREKIEDNPSKPLYIQTVWGIGYRFNKNLSSSL